MPSRPEAPASRVPSEPATVRQSRPSSSADANGVLRRLPAEAGVRISGSWTHAGRASGPETPKCDGPERFGATMAHTESPSCPAGPYRRRRRQSRPTERRPRLHRRRRLQGLVNASPAASPTSMTASCASWLRESRAIAHLAAPLALVPARPHGHHHHRRGDDGLDRTRGPRRRRPRQPLLLALHPLRDGPADRRHPDLLPASGRTPLPHDSADLCATARGWR